ncbi:MAG: molybdopterin-dependent oxidoreductase [Gemmatimonadetes bacterium]|nr:molybdopterin-dependent oxidoreductase [Gemmatimonadota bacterium]
MRTTALYQRPRPQDTADERIVTSTCAHNCGGRCVVNAHVREGRIVKISTQPGPWDPELPPLHACVRGQAAADRVYHPDRLKYPMRRVGPRGAGEFERISWDEALDETAAQMLRIRDTHGSASILDACLSGSTSVLHSKAVIVRLLNMFGGRAEMWGSASHEANVFASRHTFGSGPVGREHADFANSKLILMWGWSPGDGTFGTGTLEYLKLAKKSGTRIICVDPRQTHTSTTLADQHIFIRPSTDTAMLVAMAYVIVSEGLQDQAYLDRHVLGFDEAHLPETAAPGSSYRAYLLGDADGEPKTPEWAEAITGVPAETIAALAREFATAGPAAIQCGLAPGRTATGEQYHRAAHALAAMRGNIGVAGGNTGDSLGSRGSAADVPKLSTGDNPVKTRVNMALMADMLTRGESGGYPADIKMYISAMGNELNQYPNTGKTARALTDPENVEFVLVFEQFMTPTARFADILLPATTSWERNDIHQPWGGIGNYAIFMNQAIEPMYECRNDLDICTDLAERLGIEGYNDKSDLEWLRQFCDDSPIDDFDAFREHGVIRLPDPEDAVAFTAQIHDPAQHSFNTPSGKIEIYATGLADNPDLNGLGATPAVPTYIPVEPPEATYGLRLHSAKSKARTHSIHANQPKLARLDPQRIWIHPDDAAERGIQDAQNVRVFNDEGTVEIPAHVTDRTMPGVVSINAGAWYDPAVDGTDRGGSVNVLTRDQPSPGGSLAHNTCFVEVTGCT